MNRLVILLAFFLSATACTAQSGVPEPLLTGADQVHTYLPLLEGKRVGLLVNHTSLVGNVHLVDTLIASGVNVVRVFAPEHGFRGNADAGEMVSDGRDKATGVEIVSVYGSNKKPSSAQLDGLDVVIFDIQDVGVRFYTYISSMHYMMEACAENNIPMIIFDRPNPNGMFVDGPVLEPEFKSFVGMHPIPILHGMTVAEIARMINGEGWLANGVECDLTIIPMNNYTHATRYELPVKPSPNLPTNLSIQLYPSLCLFEGTAISVGRGTYEPFQQIGHPSFTDLPYSFTPESIEGMSKHPPFENEKVYGIHFSEENAIEGLDLQYLISLYNRFGNKEEYFISYFEKLAGTADLRKQIMAGVSEADIRASWQQGLDNFKKIRATYLLYP